MRIAAYYPWVYLMSGVERTILEIALRSRHEFTIFTHHYDREHTYPEFKSLQVVQLPRVSVKRSMASVARAAWTIATHPPQLRGYDALMVHCDGLGDLVLRKRPEIPVACFCHTPLRPVFDPHYRKRARSRRGPAGRVLYDTLSNGFRRFDQWLWNAYDYIFFNSPETRNRAVDGGLVDSVQGRFEVLNPGVDWVHCQPTWAFEPYFLVPGRIMWTKHLELAIDAFCRFKDSAPQSEFRLVLAGQVDQKSQGYFERLKRMSAQRNDIEFVVSPGDSALHNLYANCYAVLFPAFNEDWGMVPLEANAHGKPVIATDCGGPRYSQRNGQTGFLVPPAASSFAAAMQRLAENPDLTSDLGGRAREHSRRYDWSYFVSHVDDVVEELVHPQPQALRIAS